MVGDTQDNQSLNGIPVSIVTIALFSNYLEDINRKVLWIINYSLLPLLFRSCSSCATNILVFSLSSEDVDFPAMPQFLKPCLIVTNCVEISRSAIICISHQQWRGLIVDSFVSTVISLAFTLRAVVIWTFLETFRKIVIFGF